MDLGLRSKVFMVAGASRGLGYGIARVLAADGAQVSIAARSRCDIESAAQQLQADYQTKVQACCFDAKDAQSILDWTASTRQEFGRIDGLVVNAGGPPMGVFDDFDDAAWLDSFNLTLLSSVRMIRAVLPCMREQGSGSILTLTSSSVKEPIDNLLLSNVMRSGVVSLAKSLSRQLAPENIRVNNLVPGLVYTDRLKSLIADSAAQTSKSAEEIVQIHHASIPMGRYGTIDDFGKAAAFLLSDAASYITGETMIVDGGNMKTVW